MTPYFFPLIIVFVTLATLWALGKMLSRLAIKTENARTTQALGEEFAPGLHVAGLSEESINELNTLIKDKDDHKLSVFLALKKPSFIELDEYIQILHSQFLNHLNKPIKFATEIEKIAATSQLDLSHAPKGFDFARLNKSELRGLMEYDAQRRRLINHEFLSRFGEVDFMDNLRVYAELAKDVPFTLLVEKDNKYRKQVEVFVSTGIALQGRKIPLQDRLSILKISQLREMAKDLKLEQDFKQCSDATQTLAEIPGSAILLAMLVDIDDIFMIRPQIVDVDGIKSEWSFTSAYAKLLCHRT